MLLAIDIGNTNIVIGIFEGDNLIQHWRIGTKKARTADEYGIMLMDLFNFSKLQPGSIKGSCLACVVPPLLDTFCEMLERYFKVIPLVVGPGVKTGVSILTDNPKEVGADRVVNAVAGYEKYKKALIIVDFGTATTFDYVSTKGEYMGGAIAPGIEISMDALFQRAARLLRVEIVDPKKVVGKNTIESIQAGVFYGYVGLVDGIVERMKIEVGSNPKVIATGGLAGFIAHETKTIEAIEEDLTLEGLKIIYRRNKI